MTPILDILPGPMAPTGSDSGGDSSGSGDGPTGGFATLLTVLHRAAGSGGDTPGQELADLAGEIAAELEAELNAKLQTRSDGGVPRETVPDTADDMTELAARLAALTIERNRLTGVADRQQDAPRHEAVNAVAESRSGASGTGTVAPGTPEIPDEDAATIVRPHPAEGTRGLPNASAAEVEPAVAPASAGPHAEGSRQVGDADDVESTASIQPTARDTATRPTTEPAGGSQDVMEPPESGGEVPEARPVTADGGVHRTTPTSRGGTWAVERVLEAAAELENAPPPRQLTIEVGDARLRVAIEDGAVRLSVVSGDGAELLDDARDALAQHGFDLGGGAHSGDGGQARGRDPGARPSPSADAREHDDGAVRL